MTTLDDVRKTIEATIGSLSPTKAQELAKSLSDPGAAKEQVAKLATDMLDWSQRSRERMREFVAREIAAQMRAIGVATQADLDAVTRRVRALERSVAGGVPQRKPPAKKAAAGKATARKTASRKGTARKTASRKAVARKPVAGRAVESPGPSGA